MSTNKFIKEKHIAEKFFTDKIVDICPVGHGNINYTHIVTLEKPDGIKHRAILQKINNDIFPDVDALMGNIYSITEYLRKKLLPQHDPARCVMTVVKALDGKLYTQYGDEFYRCYVMVENTISYQKVESAEDFYYCGVAFADFQQVLLNYPVSTLRPAVKDYHNTIVRYNDFIKATENNKAGRKALVEKEIEFYKSRKNIASLIMDKINSKTIPIRLVHNDAKPNNLLFDTESNKPICVIDFDTVSLGAACFDFGDAIRFAGTRQSTDSDSLSVDLSLFEAYTKGYLSVAKTFLTKEEIDTLAVSALVITYECGMRFLADYLDGDVHFRTGYPHHNLDRTRNHIALVKDIEQKLPQLEQIVLKYAQ